MADQPLRGVMDGWDPADPYPWIVLVCPHCGRELYTPALAHTRRCPCGALLRRQPWTCRPPKSEEQIDEE